MTSSIWSMVSWASVSAGLSPVSRTTKHICDRTGPEAAFSPAQAKDICRPIGHHGIERVGIEANLRVSKSDFIEQIAGGGERRIAAQDRGVERMDERKRR